MIAKGEKYEKQAGLGKTLYITGFGEGDKVWRVIGCGSGFKGENYDYWQTWIPKSISLLIFNHIGGAGYRDRNRIVIPNWFFNTLKFYHLNYEDWAKMSRRCTKNTEETSVAVKDKTICVRCGLEAYDEIDHRGVCIDCNISENTLERERDHYLEEEIE